MKIKFNLGVRYLVAIANRARNSNTHTKNINWVSITGTKEPHYRDIKFDGYVSVDKQMGYVVFTNVYECFTNIKLKRLI